MLGDSVDCVEGVDRSNSSLPYVPSVREAKRAIAVILKEYGLSNRITGRTVSFQDLARGKVVVITLHDWNWLMMKWTLVGIIRNRAPDRVLVEFERD